MNLENEPVIKKFLELVETIRTYESDTFSAEASKLTRSEALKIASNLVCHKIQGMIETHTMDGDIISQELEIIRKK